MLLKVSLNNLSCPQIWIISFAWSEESLSIQHHHALLCKTLKSQDIDRSRNNGSHQTGHTPWPYARPDPPTPNRSHLPQFPEIFVFGHRLCAVKCKQRASWWVTGNSIVIVTCQRSSSYTWWYPKSNEGKNTSICTFVRFLSLIRSKYNDNVRFNCCTAFCAITCNIISVLYWFSHEIWFI